MVCLPVLPVGGDEGLGFDGVAEAGTGAVRFDGVDVGGSEAGGGEGGADDALLGRSVGRGEPVGGAVLVDRRSPQEREYRMAGAPGVREPFEQDEPDTLGPAHAVRRCGERLAAAVR